MLITAHGGAEGTGRNSKRYFDTVHQYGIDIIEVDIRKRGKLLYISHLKPLLARKCIPLSFVFDYVVKHNLRVNCDLKDRGIIGEVTALAKERNALANLIFTGSVKERDMPNITAGDVYVNAGYYFPLRPNVNDIDKIKEVLDRGNKHIVGLNISYRHASDEFIIKCKELDIPLSIYTIDNEETLRRIMSHQVANVTTNKVLTALKIRKELSK